MYRWRGQGGWGWKQGDQEGGYCTSPGRDRPTEAVTSSSVREEVMAAQTRLVAVRPVRSCGLNIEAPWCVACFFSLHRPHPLTRRSLLAPQPASSFAEGLPPPWIPFLGFLWVGPGCLLPFQNGMSSCTCVHTLIALVFFLVAFSEMSRFRERKAEEGLFLEVNVFALFFFRSHSQKIAFVSNNTFGVVAPGTTTSSSWDNTSPP